MAITPIARPCTMPSKTTWLLIHETPKSVTRATSPPRNTARARSSRSIELVHRTCKADVTLLQKYRPIRYRGGDVEGLLDDDQGHAVGLQALDDLNELVDDDRREPERQLVDHEHLGVVQQRDGERQHLLLPTGQRCRPAVLFARQHGEEPEHSFDATVQVGPYRNGRQTLPSRGSLPPSSSGRPRCHRAGYGCRAVTAVREWCR